MIRLWTLGQAGLEDSEQPPPSPLLGQAKPFALLCYLALARPERSCRRDSLIAIFWPDLDHEHGRAALRQALRVLRRCLGAEAVINRGDDETGLNPGQVWCDATAFEELCDAREPERAMALYRGDLLPGLHVATVAPELAHWLDAARTGLRRRAHDAARCCLEQYRRAGDVPAACRWARRALELDPFDESSLRDLLQLLDQSGDRAGAVQEYERFGVRLARELEIRPTAESEALITAIRGAAPAQPDAARGTGNRADGPHPEAAAHSAPVQSGRTWVAQNGGRLLLGALLGVIALGAVALWPRPVAPVTLRSDLVAVIPWRVDGADGSLGYLREGMLDLLGATLTGEGGLRSADPRTVLRLRRSLQPDTLGDTSLETALEIARRIGAGRVIRGTAVGSAAHLTLVATEVTVANPGAAHAFSVSGTIDSLPWMVERLTAQLLAHETAQPGQLPGLLTTSLAALRRYLEGRAEFRRGRYGEASHDLDEALSLDSSFTLAALGLAGGGLTRTDGQLMERGRRLAWRDAKRLSARDQALLKAVVGLHYPAAPDEREYLAAREQAVALAPESPEAQYWLADSYFHHGRLLALPDWSARARAGFERAIELDSAFAAPYQHLIELKLSSGDTVGVRRLAAAYFSLDSAAEYRDFLRWRVAVGLEDSTELTSLRAGFGRMTEESLYRIAGDAELEGIAIEDAERATAALATMTAGTPRRWVAAYAGESLRSNQGRPSAALAESPDMSTDGRRPLADRWFQVTDALYSDGDTLAAARAVEELTPLTERRAPGAGSAADSQDVATCAVALWRVHHLQPEAVGAAIRRLGLRSRSSPTGFGVWMRACGIILEARLATLQGSPAATSARARLDSLVGSGPTLFSPLRVAAILELADIRGQLGDLHGALAAVQRRENEYSPRYLSTQLLREGRLATTLGDSATALRAYRHYLALRSAPEPCLQPRVDSVRAELAALESHPRP